MIGCSLVFNGVCRTGTMSNDAMVLAALPVVVSPSDGRRKAMGIHFRCGLGSAGWLASEVKKGVLHLYASM